MFKGQTIKTNLFNDVKPKIILMNNALFISFLAVVLASALMISSGVTQLSNACPDKSSPTATSTTNPVNPTNINTVLSQSSAPQLSPSQAT